MPNKTSSFFIVVLFSLLLTTGCGKPKISGTVVYADDGSPVTHGVVIFHRDNTIARGIIKEGGKYVVGSIEDKDGLPKGQYRVSIKETQINTSPRHLLPKWKNVIHSKYESPDTSELSVDIQKSQTFDIKVDRFPEK